jgi:uncharacterized cupredoxin-like copper-binding protein
VTPAVRVALAALVLAAGGCGEERNAGGRAARTAPTPVAERATTIGKAVATVDVSLSEYRLTPANPRVARRGVIAFVATNDGQTTHELAVDGPGGEVSSVPLRPGERATLEVRLPPGTYKWLCPLSDHERRGMVGRVRVAE